jgi:putative MATE family efflux protein
MKKQASSGSMTEGTEWKLILLFTLPLMAGNVLQQLYNTFDGIIVGNFVSETALASVGTCASLTMLFVALAVGMSNGAAVVISQYFGARKMDELRRSVSTSLILFTVMGIVFSLVALVLSRVLLQDVLTVQDYLLEGALLYFRIYAVGLVFQFLYNIVAAILRSMGDSSATLYFLLISSICNILLDLLTVLAFGWGIMGVAVATVVSQAVSAVVSIVYMFKRYPELHLSRENFRFDRSICGVVIRMGIPTTLQQCVVSMGHMAVQRVINILDITAGYTAATRIESFVVIPAMCFMMGMATFTGQNLGAGKIDRIKRGVKSNLIMGLIVDALIIAIVVPLAPKLIGMFGVVGDSREVAITYLRWCSCALAIFTAYFCINGVLQGSGDVRFTAFNTISGLIIKTAFIYICVFFTPLGVASIWFGNIISWIYSLTLSSTRYLFGPWRQKGIIKQEETVE